MKTGRNSDFLGIETGRRLGLWVWVKQEWGREMFLLVAQARVLVAHRMQCGPSWACLGFQPTLLAAPVGCHTLRALLRTSYQLINISYRLLKLKDFQKESRTPMCPRTRLDTALAR